MTRAVIPFVVASVVALSACGGATSAEETTAPVPSTSSWPSELTPSSSSSGGTSPQSTSTSSSSTSSATVHEDSDEWSASEDDLAAAEKKARPAVKVAADLADVLQEHRKSPRAAWWKKVSPHLSETGKKQLRQKSPSTIGFTKVTGRARLLVTDTDMGPGYVSVAVPTDEGTYLFLTEKSGSGAKASWKVASVSKMSGSS